MRLFDCTDDDSFFLLSSIFYFCYDYTNIGIPVISLIFFMNLFHFFCNASPGSILIRKSMTSSWLHQRSIYIFIAISWFVNRFSEPLSFYLVASFEEFLWARRSLLLSKNRVDAWLNDSLSAWFLNDNIIAWEILLFGLRSMMSRTDDKNEWESYLQYVCVADIWIYCSILFLGMPENESLS